MSWSDTDESYRDARIIFIDTEVSNWTFDPVREQFYWHRFFSHQPDLNYENPEVRDAMLEVLRFWLDVGLDGFRLDAVPYLFEEEGTNCENLPARTSTSSVCGQRSTSTTPTGCCSRRRISGRKTLSPTLATGTSAPAFHFPVMPRMFMSLRREEAKPMIEILDRTPPSRPRPVGPLPAQSRRADARDGHRRGTRLHVQRVRERSADEAQSSVFGAVSRRFSTAVATRSS